MEFQASVLGSPDLMDILTSHKFSEKTELLLLPVYEQEMSF